MKRKICVKCKQDNPHTADKCSTCGETWLLVRERPELVIDHNVVMSIEVRNPAGYFHKVDLTDKVYDELKKQMNP